MKEKSKSEDTKARSCHAIRTCMIYRPALFIRNNMIVLQNDNRKNTLWKDRSCEVDPSARDTEKTAGTA